MFFILVVFLLLEFLGYFIFISFWLLFGFFGSSLGLFFGDNFVFIEMGIDIVINSGVIILISYWDVLNVMGNSIFECDDLVGINLFDIGIEINI